MYHKKRWIECASKYLSAFPLYFCTGASWPAAIAPSHAPERE